MKLGDILFFFLRHGETAGNKKNIYRGWSNDPDAQLDKEGRKTSEAAGRHLKAIGAKVELIVADSLDRVQETVDLVTLSFPEARREAVRSLHPLHMGDWTLQSKDKHPVEPFLKDTSKRIPGGENVDEFDERQNGIFSQVFDLAKSLGSGKILVVGHGSNVAYLNNRVFNTGEKVGYEGLVDPGGLIAVTVNGLVPLTRSRKGKKKEELVQISDNKLERWALMFVGGKDTEPHGAPKSCFVCPHLLKDQETCEYLSKDLIIRRVKKDGELYTPVCGYQIGGKPTVTDDPKYLGKDPDKLGLEWAKGTGTNCYGHAGGAPCDHFVHTEGEDGTCDAMKEDDNKVDSDDCCAAHRGPSISWQEAQDLLGKEEA
jgi:broad specificity phosphatase PhoE